MLEGFIPWSSELAEKYIANGYWENRTVSDMVYASADRYPDKAAVIHDDRLITYSDLRDKVDCLAYRLVGVGIKKHDRIVMQLPNSIEFVISYLALTRIGAIPVLALRAHRHTEICHFINASGAVGYMIPDEFHRFDYRQMAKDVQLECSTLKTVFVLGRPLDGQISLLNLIDRTTSREERSRGLAEVHPDPCDVATMLLSGGTTSMSKLIPRTHNDYVLNARLCAEAAGFGPDTVFMAILPLGHNYNLAAPGMLGVFYYGGTVLISPSGDAEVVFPLVEQYHVTAIATAVPLITSWLSSGIPACHDLSSLKVIQNGGARLAPELRQRIRAELHCIPQEIYGTAEGLINMTRLDDPDDLLLESSGSPVCDADEIKIIDDEGNELPDGEAGELVTRGPYTIQGYYNADEKNKEAFTADGFYRMGDICRKQGRYVFAEGRTKDLINRGGEKISCEEVENLIFKLQKVHQVALVAMPDPVFGEKACAYVSLKPGESLTFDELIEFLKKQRISSFKLPERLEIVDEFPTSLVGKILKRELREMIVKKMAGE
ncbi:(2,3-dihydroxybenzoyl)adenylate synthase [Burkholderia sp. lig30]|jgi:2,3-dihydroxybenzoate-AMP ligase|uniref:(2,3-dihydroxybenzoyl)adenylate synthase n=1 Tax=Burkholderia sp. lig30 TaxID=1192124 RepID=UPI000461CCCB|nr:AMP-binding protein [Burkholderia sp. lig30]KDB08139.1 (2,3-dihydroxybenzoyl)adenylate synthase [Burkholderia sp. lig30]